MKIDFVHEEAFIDSAEKAKKIFEQTLSRLDLQKRLTNDRFSQRHLSVLTVEELRERLKEVQKIAHGKDLALKVRQIKAEIKRKSK